MLFIVKYKDYIKGVFFDIWNATQYVNICFDQNEEVYIERVVEDIDIKSIIEKSYTVDCSTHFCQNCARSFYDNNVLICNFAHQEVAENDYCTHYL